MTTLVMFSGGLDSTAMLVKLLAESADDLHVHHIRMLNREGRDRAEQRAVEAIPIDYLSIAFVACQVAIDTPGCNRVAVGALAADTDIANRSARQKRVFEEMHACYRARKLGEPRVEWIFPVYDTPKAELAAALPQELLDLTWSCRRPIGGFRPCQVCKACRAREMAKKPAEQQQGLRGATAPAQNQG